MSGTEGSDGPATWLGRAMKQHPDILQLRESLRVFSSGPGPTPSFGRDHLHCARTETVDALPSAAVLELIIQYLHEQGYVQARDAMLQEAVTLCPELFDDLGVIVHPEDAEDDGAKGKGKGKGDADSTKTGAKGAVKDGADADDAEEADGKRVRAAGVPEFSEDLLDPSFQRALMPLLHLGVKDAKNLFGPLDNGDGDDADPEVEVYEEYEGEVDFQDEEQDVHDVNVWEEETTPENSIWKDNTPNSGTLLAGTVNQWVRWITEPKNTDDQSIAMFILGYPILVSAEKVVAKLLQRCHVPAKSTSQDPFRAVRALTVLRRWIESYPRDISGPVQEQLVHFVKSAGDKNTSGEFRQLAAALEKLDLRASPADSTVEEFPKVADGQYIPPRVPSNIFSPKLTLEDVDESEIARQLCLLDFRPYWKMQARELLGCAWRKDPSAAPNVMAMLQRERDVTRWAITCIVYGRWTPEGGVNERDRLRMYVKICRIAFYLLLYNDFAGAWALTVALSSNLVNRVVRADEQRDALFQIAQSVARKNTPSSSGPMVAIPEEPSFITTSLTSLFSPSNNFKDYRSALSRARMSSVPVDVSPSVLENGGCVPLINVHLDDITIIQDAMPDTVGPNNLLNFEKSSLQCRQIIATLENQDNFYSILPIAQIMSLLKDWSLPDDKTLLDAALGR